MYARGGRVYYITLVCVNCEEENAQMWVNEGEEAVRVGK